MGRRRRRRSKARLIARSFRIFRKPTSQQEVIQFNPETTDQPIVEKKVVLQDSAQTTIDTFDGTELRAAHYFISAQTSGDSAHQAQQIFVTHDGDTATLTSYGTLLHGTDTIVTYDASIDGNDTVSLLADPQNVQLQFSFERVDVKKATTS
tara:strand:+ start:30 stop:482 length:453 start_codon:yes stop_codon:yes gene_type:complete